MEIWDLYDINDERTGETWERIPGNYKKIPDGRFHMVCDILVKHTDGTFLLTKRHPGKDVYPGFWEASAGGSALAGESPIDCAKRELFEETGIKADEFIFISHTHRATSHSMYYSYLVVTDCPKDSIVLQEGETTEYKWVDRAGLIEYLDSDLAIKPHNDRYKDYFEQLRREEASGAYINTKIRLLRPEDVDEVVEMIHKTIMISNGKDYPPDITKAMADAHTPEFILRRSTWTHFYIALDGDTIIGCGAIGPYWNSETESSLFTIFVLPEYQRKGVGRAIIEALESDEYFLRANRIVIPASITGVPFYTKMGYGFKNGISEPDEDHIIRMEKFR